MAVYDKGHRTDSQQKIVDCPRQTGQWTRQRDSQSGNAYWKQVSSSSGVSSVTDVRVNGTSVVNQGVANVTVPTSTGGSGSTITAVTKADYDASSGYLQTKDMPLWISDKQYLMLLGDAKANDVHITYPAGNQQLLTQDEYDNDQYVRNPNGGLYFITDQDSIKLIIQVDSDKTHDKNLTPTATYDDQLDDTSVNAVQNKVVKAQLDTKQDTLTIDTAMSSTSTNPVENKVIQSQLNGKQDTLTIDTAMSSSSSNPVQNKAIASWVNSNFVDWGSVDSSMSSTSWNPVSNRTIVQWVNQNFQPLSSG